MFNDSKKSKHDSDQLDIVVHTDQSKPQRKTSRRFEKIASCDVKLDLRYQRAYDEPRAIKMSEAFDADRFGVPVVSERKDGYYAVDGQHRIAAARMSGNGGTRFLMEVHSNLTLQEESKLFLQLNGGRTAVKVFDKFKARIVAQEPDALDIVSMLKKHDLKFTKSVQRRGVCCIEAIEAVYNKGNLPTVLKILVGWTDEVEPECFEKTIVRAMSYFLSEYPEVNVESLIQRLQDQDPAAVTRRLKNRTETAQFKSEEAACIEFRAFYNRRRKESEQLPPPGMKK